VTTFTYGRKVLGDDQAFAFDLLALYRYKKDRAMLISEYIHVLSFNPDAALLRQAENSFSALFESDKDYSLLEEALEKVIKKRVPQTELTKKLLSWTYIQQEKYADALNVLINLDKKTGSETELIFNTGTTILARKAFKEALPAFEYVALKGSSNTLNMAAKARILYCKTEILSLTEPSQEEIDGLTQEYRAFINVTTDVEIRAFSLRKLAEFNAYRIGRYAKATRLLQEALSLSGLGLDVKNNIKLDLGDVSVLTDDVWEATLLYSQVEKDTENTSVKQEARFRNARLSYFRGDFVWAQAQLNDLKVTTDQMLANDALNLSLLVSEHTQNKTDTLVLRNYAKADMMVFSKRYKRATAILDSIESAGIVGSLADDILMLRARIHLDLAEYAKAAGALQEVAEKHSAGIWADDALFLLGDIYETLKEPDKAKVCYEKIITDYPGSLYISEARVRFRNLRGDSLG
jgi:tetratricopeptide (TPR) repeat protein